MALANLRYINALNNNNNNNNTYADDEHRWNDERIDETSVDRQPTATTHQSLQRSATSRHTTDSDRPHRCCQWRFRAGAGGGGTRTSKSWLSPKFSRPRIVARFPNLAVLLTHCCQLILRKISKLDATRCQILQLKCTKFVFSWGSLTPLGKLTALPRPTSCI